MDVLIVCCFPMGIPACGMLRENGGKLVMTTPCSHRTLASCHSLEMTVWGATIVVSASLSHLSIAFDYSRRFIPCRTSFAADLKT